MRSFEWAKGKVRGFPISDKVVQGDLLVLFLEHKRQANEQSRTKKVPYPIYNSVEIL